MNEELLRALMTDVDPVRDLSDDALDELVPHHQLMARITAGIENTVPEGPVLRTPPWRRVSVRVSAAATAVALVATGAVAFLGSAPSTLQRTMALGALPAYWGPYDVASAPGTDANYSPVSQTYSMAEHYSAQFFVKNGRIVKRLSLEAMTISPAPASIRPRVSATQMAKMLWATSQLKGYYPVAFAYGEVSLSIHTSSVSAVHDYPAWIAIASAHAVICTTPRACKAAPLGSSRLAIVVMGYGLPNRGVTTGIPVAFVYKSTGANSAAKPRLSAATEQVSVPWIQDGPVKNHLLHITVAPLACGYLDGYHLAGGTKTTTLTVRGLVPDSTFGDYCALAIAMHKVIPLTSTSHGVTKWIVGPSTAFLHSQTGPIRATS